MEVMCQIQRGVVEKRGIKLSSELKLEEYNICGKSGLQMKAHCLPIPLNYREHAFLPFAYNFLGLFSFSRLVWCLKCCLKLRKSDRTVDNLGEGHTHAWDLWFPLLQALTPRETQWRIPQCQRKTPARVLLRGSAALPVLLEHSKDQNTAGGQKLTPGSLLSTERVSSDFITECQSPVTQSQPSTLPRALCRRGSHASWAGFALGS